MSTEKSRFFKFVVNRKNEGAEDIPLNVCVNLDYVIESHDDYIEGQRILIIILSEKRDIIKDVPVGHKNKTEPRKVQESISYIVEDLDAINRFWETI